MQIPVWAELGAIFILILLNGVFSLAEFSIIAARRSKLRQKVEEGKRGADAALRLKERPERFLATIQVGITLVAAMVGVFSGATIVDALQAVLADIPVAEIAGVARPLSMVLVVIGVTVLSVVIGELFPKYLALTHPARLARYVAPPISVFIAVTKVFSHVLSAMAVGLLRLFGIRQSIEASQITEEEINQMITDGREKGVFDDTELEFVRSVFDFADSPVSRAMKPRTDVIAFEIGVSIDTIIETVRRYGYSRYPVFRENIDNVVGVIHVKDLLRSNGEAGQLFLEGHLREPLFVPNSMPLPNMLREFQKGANHMAVVLDEYGGTDGIITLEDTLEELVGEIKDEYDAEDAPLVRHSDTVVFADGAVWPGEINEMIRAHLPEDDVDTVAGLFIDTVGHVPEKGETVTIEDARLTVLEKEQNRIQRLKIEKIPRESNDVS
jgi:putative hemolysin